MKKEWVIYLSGEIHSNWRDTIEAGIKQNNLPIIVYSPITDHNSSDNVGVNILGEEEKQFWKDKKGAGINSIRTSSLIKDSDFVIVKFGDKYKQWNAAFDAGMAVAYGIPLITLHETDLDHALKEVDAAGSATARTPEQIIEILKYITVNN